MYHATKPCSRLENKLSYYGIQNENSDTRVHVCVNAREVWCYPTDQGRLVMYNFPTKPAFDEESGEVTGRGHIVPPLAIPHCRLLRTDPSWFNVFPSDQKWFDTSQKGELAVQLVCNIIRNFDFPYLPMDWKVVEDVKLQVEGKDIILGPSRVQVKCDWKGGRRPKGTGNLFLQIGEINKYGKY